VRPLSPLSKNQSLLLWNNASYSGINAQVFSRRLGSHVMIDYQVTDSAEQVTPALLLEVLRGAADEAKAHQLLSTYCSDSSGNISAIVVIQESHLSLHYCFTTKRLIMDCFTCGEIDEKAAELYIANYKSLALKRVSHKKRFVRGLQKQDNEFLCGVGLLSKKSQPGVFNKPSLSAESTARHAVLELFHCDSALIESPVQLRDIFLEALYFARVLDGEELSRISLAAFKESCFTHFHRFQPQGLSIVVMGPGFHVTTHTWPEYGYAPVDIFSRQSLIDVDKAAGEIAKRLSSMPAAMAHVPRGQLDKLLLSPH